MRTILKLSIIICTYNRQELLALTLNNLFNVEAKFLFDVWIVDNNSNDSTYEVYESFKSKHVNLFYHLEEKAGLSYARNKGLELATGDWICFLDDDVIVDVDFFNQLENTIKEDNYDCFGGAINPHYYFGRPRWIPDSFERNIECSVGSSYPVNSSDLIWGCLMVFRGEIIRKYRFNVLLGMNGESVGYGEDSKLIDQLIEDGYRVGIDPKLKIDHIVGKHKLNLSWHFQSAFARGKAAIFFKNRPILTILAMNVYHLIRYFPMPLIRALRKVYLQKNYYLENFLLDSFQHHFHSLGMINACLSKLYHRIITILPKPFLK